MSLFAIEVVVELLVIATVVAVLARRLRVPYTVFLVLVGLLISLLKHADIELFEALQDVELSKDLILLIFLPPLLFEGTIHMDLEILRRNAVPVAVLAIPGTLILTGLLGATLHLAFGLGVAGALLLGAMLAPTDPVSVLALFKSEGVDKDLATLVEGESVFNDGIGVVLFLIFLKMVTATEPVTVANALGEFVWEIAVGGGIGLVLGYAAHRLLGTMDDRFTETMISVALAYGVYVVAERFHASGVIAVVTAGLIIGNYGKVLSMSPSTRLALGAFWEVAAFMVNSILFLMMGMAGDARALGHHWKPILVTFLALLLGRSLIVYASAGLLNRFRPPLSWTWQHVMNWGGLKGSIPIALVLGLPAALALPAAAGPLGKADVTQIVFGVVLLSLLLQGLSIGPLLKRLGFGHVPVHERHYEMLRGRTISVKAALESLERLHRRGELSESVHRGVRAKLENDLSELSESRRRLLGEHHELNAMEYRKVAASLLLAERTAIEDAYRQGLLSGEATELLVEELDTKLASEDGKSPFYTDAQTDEVPDFPQA